ncbi:monovalent cation/H+ antiporter subunit A [Mycolicibacter terrae]|uniref:Monovalent cation/H+ antiporter subunit A n=1 Tax=Mycolicibacter terrae TaxID=1788 RepID=A0AAD1HY37_9MYCO|nr:Na+/H+ antiporter subunit A [Mycolicibacter terrae]ORW88732.1 cation:proton antiporter [Mycolicibacter terrae]BBX23752.1 monovalent cation/H+ antiporter subunit A [Mycolicibacter terrae]SNV60261.1 NADH ubiquinone oxidoreductase subunit 5 [Mycolicibacter terrae]
MLAILLAHTVGAVIAPLLVRRWGRAAFYPLGLIPLVSLVWVVANWPAGPADDHRTTVSWVPGLSMNIDLRFDSLAAIMSALALGIGALVLFYCAEYFRPVSPHTDLDPRLPSFAAKMIGFAGSMFGLMVADNMLALYVFWELTTVLSFLLVGHYAERAVNRRAAIQALVVTTAGGLAMLVGIIMLGETAGTYLLSELVASPPSGTVVTVGVLLVLVGALSKSAIMPLHFWLPGAMAAPTPVSAYLHAAAMVKAGIYLVARLTPGFADSPGWRPTVVVLGLATALLAGWRAIREYDLKLVLAYSTVSQLGLMIVLVGAGGNDLMLAGLTAMCAHAAAKAALFMVVGIIDHATGTRDLRELAGLGRRSPGLFLVAAAAAASMAGVPPFVGFIAKETIFGTEAQAPTLGASIPYVLGAAVLASMFTVIYSARFVWGGFAGKGRSEPSTHVAELHSPTVAFMAAPAVLAVTSLVLGLWPLGLDSVLHRYSDTVPDGADYHLALWHGPGLPVFLSATVLAVGAGIFLARGPLQLSRLRRLPLGKADELYDESLRLLDVAAVRLTALTQRGSLPFNQAVIFATLILLPLGALMLGARDRVDLQLWDTPLQLTVAVLVVAGGVGATLARNRLSAVLMVGVTGYGCAVAFAFHGAPDLALTQLLVETVTVVIFVLVLRTLPAETARPTMETNRLSRAVLSIMVGASVAVLGAFAMAARTGEGVAGLLPEAAYLRGYGANTVNVILVDIRAWDTLGEISVLLVAATGVASMVFRTRRFGRAPRTADPDAHRMDPGIATPYSPAVGSTTWLRGSAYYDPDQRSLVLEVASRVIFPLIMVVSVYFLFAGHNNPGGGFAGGLAAGLALALRYVAGGRYELGETLPLDSGKILGVGLSLVGGTALASLFVGAPVLSSAAFTFTLPVLGQVKLVSSLFFDLGVYLVVVGMVLDVLRSLGARLDQVAELQRPAQRSVVRAP